MYEPFCFPVDAVLLLGPTGAGKSPLGEMIAQKGFLGKRAHHLDFGSELRSLAAGNGCSAPFSSCELDFIRGVLHNGLLLENEYFSLARKIIWHYLIRVRFLSGDILVLNGIPRHIGQARDMSSFVIINSLIVLECSEDAVLCRLRDNIGGDRTGRMDDNRELVKFKLTTYAERTAPLIEHYERSDSMIYRITMSDCTTTNEAYSQLFSLSSAYPPVSFVSKPPQG
jgi:adenylate kinase family enzyme